jgi:hypothetical protein
MTQTKNNQILLIPITMCSDTQNYYIIVYTMTLTAQPALCQTNLDLNVTTKYHEKKNKKT